MNLNTMQMHNILRVAILGIGMFFGFHCKTLESAQQATPDDLLETLVTIPQIREDNWVCAIESIRNHTRVPIHYEVLLRRSQAKETIIKGFAIPAGTCRLRELLERVKPTVPSMDWFVGSNVVNIILRQEAALTTPLDEQVGKGFLFKGNLTDLSWWFFTQHYGILESTGMNLEFDSRKQVRFAVHADMTLREFLNRYVELNNGVWDAIIMDTHRITDTPDPFGRTARGGRVSLEFQRRGVMMENKTLNNNKIKSPKGTTPRIPKP